MNKIPIETELLQKIAQFVRLAQKEVKNSQTKIASYQEREEMNELKHKNYRKAVKQAAKVLYDTDYITDEDELDVFVKKASTNPLFIVQTLEKVCNAADVSLIGKPARVAAKTATTDPIYNKAFGLNSSSNYILDDD